MAHSLTIGPHFECAIGLQTEMVKPNIGLGRPIPRPNWKEAILSISIGPTILSLCQIDRVNIPKQNVGPIAYNIPLILASVGLV